MIFVNEKRITGLKIENNIKANPDKSATDELKTIEINGKVYRLVDEDTATRTQGIEQNGQYVKFTKNVDFAAKSFTNVWAIGDTKGKSITTKELIDTPSKISSLNDKIEAIKQLNKFKVVDVLPTTDIDKTLIYLLPKTNEETNNVYDEYIYINDWEKIGSTKVSLDDYYTKEEIDVKEAEIVNNYVKYIEVNDIKKAIIPNYPELLISAQSDGSNDGRLTLKGDKRVNLVTDNTRISIEDGNIFTNESYEPTTALSLATKAYVDSHSGGKVYNVIINVRYEYSSSIFGFFSIQFTSPIDFMNYLGVTTESSDSVNFGCLNRNLRIGASATVSTLSWSNVYNRICIFINYVYLSKNNNINVLNEYSMPANGTLLKDGVNVRVRAFAPTYSGSDYITYQSDTAITSTSSVEKVSSNSSHWKVCNISQTELNT